MAQSTGPVRTLCSDCGERCRVHVIELMFHTRYKGERVWQYENVTLCPPHRSALVDSFKKAGFRTTPPIA